MTIKYTLSPEQASKFHIDEERSLIRSSLVEQYPSQAVQVLNEEGELLDNIGDEETSEVELAVALNPEELESKRVSDELERQQADHLETVLKPLVIQRITADVRREFREQLRDKTDEVLKCRASLARLERDSSASTNKLRSELILLRAENTRLRSKHTELLSRLSEVEEQLPIATGSES